ncbi:glycosyltransferase [Paenibacillaceae bacterium WGS1546]|uniref:glycosyltransferase n=1 Tax=Cohnella sp. WGS1546 TaxID=3366810 RepID=UPI00372CE82F
MKVWMWPKYSEMNLYNNLLTDSLRGAGVDVADLTHGKLTLRVGRAKPGDVVHVHWMHHAYQHRNPLLFAVKSAFLLMTLVFLKLRRVRLIWTLHNLYPHEVKYCRMERGMRKLISRFCARLIVASESIKRQAMAEFGIPASKLTVVKHGHYADAYKPGGVDVRQLYGIGENAAVYLFLGAIKAYKGVEELIAAFNAVKTETSYLIIAGKADREMETYIRNVRDTANLILDLRFIPNGEVADLIGAADVMVMPYKEITTSGSAILGLSFRKLIVMPDNGFIDEYFAEDMVVRYDPGDAAGLAGAMETAMGCVKEGRTPDYDKALRQLEWGAIAERIKNVYQGRDER